ncbi:MAG: asparagine synthase (glutamine-hydrolyzing) [Actinomycetia bacterium]|nr:asparagine synthase (glutamine-hydrolyzing) [Actinomycetes bacterium]
MCGICGLLSLRGGRADEGLLQRMNSRLVHRGPDGEGRYVDGSVALAMRRLAIIDIDGGDQPIGNEDQTVQVIQNGEIYNYRELRAGLEQRGHTFTTHSDTEVLVHLYEERGPEFLSLLRGMFAIALWDARRRQLLLARDRFGIKPLYYRLGAGELMFASELKAVPPGEIDLDALEAFLAFNAVPAPYTIDRGVRKLPAGHRLLAGADGSLELERFARAGADPAVCPRTDSWTTLAEELRARLRDSVRAHLVSDVPVGVLLSGGIDSSALAALASQEGEGTLSSFSIGFEERSFDELELARLAARRYRTEHHELVLRPDAAALLPEIVEAFDEPFADSAVLPTYLVARLAADHVKVVLSGEGGDELFGGYYTYVADELAPRLEWLSPALLGIAERLPSSSRRVSFDYKAKRFARGLGLPALERHHAWKEIFSSEARAELVNPDRRSWLDPVDLLRARYAETEGADELARLQDVDVGVLMADDLLVRTDRASMAHSLEVRVPFLDTLVADFAFALPRSHKVRGFAKKRLLRSALAPLLPPGIVAGPKRGFSIPAAAWLRGELAPFAREVLAAETIRSHGFFEPRAVTRLLDRHIAREEDLSRQLWGLLSFTLWWEQRSRQAALV